MAVFNPGTPDLTKAYANIQEALKSRQDIAAQDTGGMGVANAIVQPVADFVQKRDAQKQAMKMEVFKSTLKNDLDNRQFERDLKKEGRQLVTPESAREFEKQMNWPEGSLKEAEGRYLTPEETTTIGEKLQKIWGGQEFTGELSKEKDGAKKSAAAKASGSDKAAEKYLESEFTKNTAFGAMTPVKDTSGTSSTGWTYISRDKAGNITQTGLEAPDPTKKGGSGPASLDPRKRKEALRKDYDARLDKAGFLNVQKSFQIASNAEQNPSVANDEALIYAVAQAREPQSRLTDQDFKHAAEAGSLSQDLQQYYNKVKGNKKLNDDVRKSLVDSVQQSYGYSSQQVDLLDEDYAKKIEEEGLTDEGKPSDKHRVPLFRVKMMRNTKTGVVKKFKVWTDGRKEEVQ